MAIWEGSGNVIALDVLRAISREPESVDAFLAEVSRADGAHPAFDEYLADTRALLADVAAQDSATAARGARRLAEQLALTLQASLMIQHAPAPAAEAFVGARLGPDRSRLYGSLPGGTDFKAILDRH